MTKRHVSLLVACLAAGLCLSAPLGAAIGAGDGQSSPAATNLIINPGFELAANGDKVQGWAFDSWQKSPTYSRGSLDATVAHGGKHSLLLNNLQIDDSRFVQHIAVKPNQWYRFTVWVKTEGIGGSEVGAHLSVMDILTSTADIKGTKDWTQVVVYGRTGPQQTSLPLALRLGYYRNDAKGKAWFDDLAMAESGLPPAGAAILQLYNPPQPSTAPQGQGIGGLSTPQWTAWGLVLCLGFILIAIWLRQQAAKSPRIDWLAKPGAVWWALGALAIAVALKLALATGTVGYPEDIQTFEAWSGDLVRLGPWGFYRPGYFADYPPAYLYILSLVGAMLQLTQAEPNSPLFLIIIKFPAIAADIGAVWLLWRMVGGRPAISQNPWLILAPLLWLFSPLASFNSSVWGQVDSVFCLILAAAFWKLEKRRLLAAAILYALAVLCKPQALLVAPLALLWLARLRPFTLKSILVMLAGFVGTVVVLALPFGIGREPLWIFKLYAATLASYDYASLNAANLWFLLGQNWAANTNTFLGLTYSVWGWVLSLGASAWVLFCLWKNRLEGGWLFGAFAIYVVFFAFAVKMHERYLFPAALLGLAAYALLRDRRVLWAAIGAGLISFLNILATLQIRLTDNKSMVPHDNPLMLVASIAMLGLAAYAIYLCFALLWQNRVRIDQPLLPEKTSNKGAAKAKAKAPPPPEPIFPLPDSAGRTKAILALGLITLVYGIVALAGLGSSSSPQKFWEPTAIGESATVDLGKSVEIKKIEYHIGLGTGEYSLEFSDDGTNWKAGTPIINANLFAEFRWRALDDTHTARYLKISLTKGQQQLNEIILAGPDDKALPIASVSPAAATALFDEQSTRVAVSTYYNGMYFDEVYFARSAWEMLQGRNATENTHPPLGKIIIAGSVALFGMNPLAWRLPGTLVGIAMIPMMYLLALRLFRSRKWAVVAALLLAVDFMHFTQTRIGTVDTYVMFFVLAAYYWMLRWYQDSKDRLANQVVQLHPMFSLVFSGMAIAVAIATKWIGLYAAAGLAVMFFGGFAWLGREWRQQQAIKTLLLCVFAFVAIPLAVYCAAYIPLMSVTGTGLRGMVDNQFSMWDYHSHMRDSHPFSSEWYTWPLMLKPIWYYGGAATVNADMASTIVNFGNPVVWYGGSLAIIFLAISLWVRPQLGEKLTGGRIYNRQIAWFILVAVLAQYLPWALIPRKLVFIYHFFLTVPFIMLALVFALREFSASMARWRYSHFAWKIVVGLAVVFFIIYFPVLGGTPFPRWWGEALQHYLWIPVNM